MRMLESDPMAMAPPVAEPAHPVEDAVAQARFGDRAQTGNRAGSCQPFVSCGCICVQWMKQQPRVSIQVVEHPFDRPRTQGCLDLVDLASCSARCMCSGLPAGKRRVRARSSGATARRLCGATPMRQSGGKPGDARDFMQSRAKRSRSLPKRICPGSERRLSQPPY